MMCWMNKNKNGLTAVSGSLIVIAMIAHFMLHNELLKTVSLLAATMVAGVPIFIRAIQALRLKAFSIELLVSIAVIGALFIGEYVESAAVTFLFMFGAYLEGRTLEKTRSSLRKLIDMQPQEATVIRDGKTIEVDVEEVEVGDRVLIRPGGKVPVDGRVLSGSAQINEAAVTGESVPAMKKINDQVFSGTIVDDGYIEIIAEKVGDDTTFARIIELVEEAQESKSKTEKFLDRFANIYTPAVVVLAILVYIVTQNVLLSVTFLVVACPGALVIGAPVSNVAGIGNGAKNGVLVKGGEVVDQLSKVDTIVFDKTGTLTKGKPEVTEVKVVSEINENELLRLVAIMEKMSEHHLGKTIVKEANARQLNIDVSPEHVEIVKGNGLKGKIENHTFVIGNRSLMNDEGITIQENIKSHASSREKLGNTAIFIAMNGKIVGIISIMDQIREDAKEAIAELRGKGIKKIIMLTGDNKHTAKLVSDQLGLDEYHAELLPEDKVAHIKQLKAEGHIVAMAGDGINDAPAIATAHIGLAMGEGGTDVSMETADVVLMADQLSQFSHAYALSKETIKNMKQNIFLAVGTVFLLLIGVMIGKVHLATGMFIHEASVLIVILNAMRLIKFKGKRKSMWQPA